MAKPRVKAGTSKSAGLTAKQEAFALAVITEDNASDAYRASYAAGKMSAEAINVEASRLLANPKIALRIAELRAPALEAAAVSADRTIQEVADVAYASPKLPGETIKYGEKLAALEMLMKHQGLYKKDNKQKAPNVSINVVLE